MTIRDKQGGPEAVAGGGDREDDPLISLLYGELTGPDAERERARLAADPALTSRMEALQRVRTLFGGLAEEEPPARASAMLMTEAARSAPRRGRVAIEGGPEAGFWARLVSWLQPIARHPALAAAASVVLVAGLAGVLLLRKGQQLTETHSVRSGAEEAPPPPPAPPTEVEVGGVAPADSLAPGAAALQSSAPPQAATEAADQGGDLEDRKEQDAERSRAAPGKPTAHASDKAPPVGKVNAGPIRTKPAKKADLSSAAYGVDEEEAADQAPAEGRGGASSLGAAKGGGGAAAPDAIAPPPANQPSPVPSAEQAQPQAPAPSTRKNAAGSKDASSPKVKQLLQRALDAALDRRCADVRALDGEVRRLDLRFDEEVFRRDARLRDCLRSTGPTKK